MPAADNKALANAIYLQAFSDNQPERAAAQMITRSNPHLKPGDRGMAVASIWRVADGKIAERRDVVQEIPDNSANDNTMI